MRMSGTVGDESLKPCCKDKNKTNTFSKNQRFLSSLRLRSGALIFVMFLDRKTKAHSFSVQSVVERKFV